MKKVMIMLLAAMSVTAMAQQVKVGDIVFVDDINYKVTSLEPAEMEVTESPYAEGDLVIYGELEHYDKVYKVTKIAPMAFSNGTDENNGPKSVVIPEGIVEIGWQAFLGCNRMKTIHFPSTLQKVGNSAFYCYNDKKSWLESVTCDAVVPPTCGEMVWGSRFNAHDGNDRNIPLNVPKGSVQAYRDAKGWEYFNIITDGEESSIVDEIIVPVDDDQAIEDVDAIVGLDMNKPMYDMLGKKVNGEYKGIVIQNGKKFVK